MSPTHTATTVDAWLEWFATEKQAACRAYLCTRYSLNALDAEACINAALLQVWRYWARLEHPLAYVWQTLKRVVAKQGQRHAHERRGLAAYAQQHRPPLSEHTTQYVTDLLAHVSPRQRRLLEWYAAGVEDVQVAVWLQTTPQAVRVARHGAYRALRTQLCPSNHLSRGSHTPASR